MWMREALVATVAIVCLGAAPRISNSPPTADADVPLSDGRTLHVLDLPLGQLDGFVLDGSLLKPPDFDPKRRYPVWVMTYAGPHMPTVHDSWGGGRPHDEMLAQLGFVVFHIDPRSATDKGHRATWTAYRRLGVQELRSEEIKGAPEARP